MINTDSAVSSQPNSNHTSRHTSGQQRQEVENSDESDAENLDEIGSNDSRDSACVSPKLLLPAPNKPNQIPNTDAALCQALLVGKLSEAVDICVYEKRWAEAMVLAHTANDELFKRVKQQFLKENNNQRLGRLLSAVTLGDWQHLVEWISVEQWREALVAILTYDHHQVEVNQLVQQLANRMVSDHGSGLANEAEYCLLVAADVTTVVSHLLRNSAANNATELVQLVEKCVILRKSLNGKCSAEEAQLLFRYASLLSDNGLLNEALSILPAQNESNFRDLVNLKNRLQQSLSAPQQQQRQQPVQNFQQPRGNQGLPNRQMNSFQQPLQPRQNNQFQNPQQFQRQQNIPPSMNRQVPPQTMPTQQLPQQIQPQIQRQNMPPSMTRQNIPSQPTQPINRPPSGLPPGASTFSRPNPQPSQPMNQVPPAITQNIQKPPQPSVPPSLPPAAGNMQGSPGRFNRQKSTPKSNVKLPNFTPTQASFTGGPPMGAAPGDAKNFFGFLIVRKPCFTVTNIYKFHN